MGTRRTARTLALQVLYRWNLQQDVTIQAWENWVVGDADPSAVAFAKMLVDGVIAHRESVDALISKHTRNWAVDRLSMVDRNVLRIGIFELMYCDDIPSAVTINEAIEVAKQFGDDDSGSFVNGVLDALAKSGSTLQEAK